MRRPALLALFASSTVPLLAPVSAHATNSSPCDDPLAAYAVRPPDGQSQLSLTFTSVGTIALEATYGGSWQDFGELAIGASPVARQTYTGGALGSCDLGSDGRELVYSPQDFNGGVQAQRRVFVPVGGVAGGYGVRFFDTITNPTATPITTDVVVGDITNDNTAGGLAQGLDATYLRTTSSGDDALDGTDQWLVTSDARSPSQVGASYQNSQPAVAHIWGGADAPHAANSVRFGGATGIGRTSIDDDATQLAGHQLGWAWRNVTLQPGESASFLSWELPAITDARTWETQSEAAAEAAAELTTDPATLLQRLTPTQIKQIRNWQPPEVEGQITPVTGASTEADTVLAAREVDFGVGVDQCDSGTFTWNFGDGSTATGGVVSHRFAAGEAEVTLTINSACGGQRVRTTRFTVSRPAAPQPGGEQAQPDPLRVFGPPSIQTTTLAGKGGLAVTVVADVDGKVRMVLTGRGVKSVKTVTVKAGQAQVVRVRLAPSARPAALKLDSIRLRSKLTPTAGGGETIDNLYLALKK